MHILFVHQNFPAQFRFIAPRLINEHGWTCSFCTERAEGEIPGVRKILYKARGGASMANSIFTRNFENAVAHAHGVFEALKEAKDVQPDIVVAHTGFGSSLFLPFLYDAPIINFLEFLYSPVGQDLGFRPEVPVGETELLRSKTNNAMILLDVNNCTRGWTPTHYQRDFFPPELRTKIEVIFDGIDTSVYYRKEGARERICEQYKIDPTHKIVTYVARGFEMMRGFDVFMKAAKRICDARADVTLIVVGTDKVHYGGDLKYIEETTLRHHILKQDNYDLNRFRFTGYVASEVLADILSAGDTHIYLTEPFIASWSMVDAMACGSVLIASDQTCVREYVKPGVNGLLVNFFDDAALAKQVLEVLNDLPSYQSLRDAAMKTVVDDYSLDVALPRIKDFFERTAALKREPSQRLDKLVRAGTLQVVTNDPEALAKKARLTDTRSLTPGPANAPVGSPLEQAIVLIRQLGEKGRTIADWVRATMNFRGPAPDFESIGPRNHPIDLQRLMQRLAEWKAQTVVEVGGQEGGTLFLFSQMATDDARLISAATVDRTIAPQKAQFFDAMARVRQKIVCIPAIDQPEALEPAIDRALDGRKIDFLFLHGRRSYKELSADYRRLRKKVRSGGLIAWDGISPIVAFDPEREGGHRLWLEVQNLYPQRAEYLNGTSTEFGGIVMVKL